MSLARFIILIQTEAADKQWSNKDLEPAGPEQRTWTWYNLPPYWFSVVFSATGWNVAASLVPLAWCDLFLSLSLRRHTDDQTWDQAFISCCLGSFIAAVAVTGMARPEATYHIGFPVLARSAFGICGSYFFVFLRAVVCIIWYGIQTYYGANMLSLIFRCMFGYRWTGLANALPASADVTSQQLLCFFIVWLLELSFVCPITLSRLFELTPTVLRPPDENPLALHHQRGHHALCHIRPASQSSNTTLGWAVMDGINVIMGSLSTMLVNQVDLVRYCKKPRDAGWPQGVTVFVSKVVVFFLGLASTASIQGAWRVAYYLDHYWTAASRTAV
ncbi:permease for cytosine/purines, uracil, thiamine, allantoin-domain-containing protein [Aspergillus aurantiobrunneus]